MLYAQGASERSERDPSEDAFFAMTTIYLSSTYEDLKDHRRIVYEALSRAGYNVITIDDYGADPRPVDVCLRNVELADIYVGIFAFRYGYVPALENSNPDGLSITELELRHAERLGKPVLPFVLSDRTPWPTKFMDVALSESNDPVRKLRQYLLATKAAQVFSSPSELAQLVVTALVRMMPADARVVPVDGNPSTAPLHSGDGRATSAGDGVFVCYARKDEQFVLRLAENLKRNGVSIWLDQWDIPPGADWDRSIDDAIYDCRKLIIILSPRAIASSEVRGEFRTALDERKPVIPVISAECKIPRQLRTIQYVNFSSHGPNDEVALRRLMNTLATATDTGVVQDITPAEEAAEAGEEEPTQVESKRGEDRDGVIPAAPSNASKGSHIETVVTPKQHLTWFQRRLAIVRENYPRGFHGLSSRYAATVGVLIILAGWWQWPRSHVEAPLAPPTAAVDPAPVRKAGETFSDRLKIGGDGPQMVVLPTGSFQMGDQQGKGDKDEIPVHSVRLNKPFALSRFEVTFDEYDAFAKATNRKLPDDRGWGRGRRPVINVSWGDAQAYAKWLSEQTGKRYRLPSEAEWEYAARAGSKTEYWWGDNIGMGQANCDGCGSQWDGKQTARVGSFRASPFGLFDTAGNVWEWLEDCRHENYNGAPSDGRPWKEENGGQCAQRMIRGSSWGGRLRFVRSSARGKDDPDLQASDVGFRLARDIK